MGTHPIFESDFDCLTEMLSRSLSIISRSVKSVDRSHLAGVVPKTHENRKDSIKLGGKLAFDPVNKKFRTAVGGVKDGGDLTTHTGQKFDEGDFRVNRFLGGKTKHISQNWAIDMIAEEPVIPYDGLRYQKKAAYDAALAASVAAAAAEA